MNYYILAASFIRACFGHDISDQVGHSQGHSHGHSHSHLHQDGNTSRVNEAIASILVEHVFNYGARMNTLLATVIIQATPCILVFLIPGLKDIDTETNDSVLMTILESFALGTLLGDIFDHLLPETFEMFPAKVASFNLFIGFLGLLLLDKIIKIINGGQDINNHGHSHHQSHTTDHSAGDNEKSKAPSSNKIKENNENNIGKYVHVFTGLIHHMVDGLVLASSFYASTATGVTTCIAVLCHEVPHEIGDFSIMISNGFSFWGALRAQLTIAVSAVAGAGISCYLNEIGDQGSSIQTEILLPITAGGFIYMATTSILPRILATNQSNSMSEMTRLSLQLVSILVGFNMISLMG